MKMFRKIIILTILMLSILLLNGCTKAEEVYDNNALIARNADTKSALMMYYNNVGNNFKSYAKRFTGSHSFGRIEIEDEQKIDLELTIEEGKFKIVLISESDEVFTICEQNYSGEMILSNIESGKYRLKIVGLEAKFDLKIDIK